MLFSSEKSADTPSSCTQHAILDSSFALFLSRGAESVVLDCTILGTCYLNSDLASKLKSSSSPGTSSSSS